MPGRLSAVAAVAVAGFGVGFAAPASERPAPDAGPALGASLVNEVEGAARDNDTTRLGRAAAIPALRLPKAPRRPQRRPTRDRAATRAVPAATPAPAATASPTAAPEVAPPAAAAPAPPAPRAAPRKPPLTFDTSG